MGTMSRRRSSTIPSKINLSGKLIRHGSWEFDFDRHAAYLEERRQDICQLYQRRAATLKQCAAALICGRIIGAADNEPCCKRLNYCRQNSICPCCMQCREMSRAKGIANQALYNGTRRLIAGVFTLPSPDTYEESLVYLAKALKGKRAISQAIVNWNRRAAMSQGNHISEYALGLHLKQVTGGQWMWSHLHLVCVAGKDVRMQTTQHTRLEEVLSNAFDKAVDLGFTPKTRFENKGTLATKKLTADQQKKQHRGKSVDFGDVQREMAYAFNLHEKDDDPAAVALRLKMLSDLEVKSTLTRSRDKSQSTSAASQPHLFHPHELKKNLVQVFEVAPEKVTSIAASDFDSELRRISAEATSMLQSFNLNPITK